MRLHRALSVAFVLCASPAFAQSEHDRSKENESLPRAKKMHVTEAPHSPLFIEQKEAPGVSKTAMHSDAQPRLFDKAKE